MAVVEDVFGLNESYMVELYELFRENPTQVPDEFRRLFETWTPFQDSHTRTAATATAAGTSEAEAAAKIRDLVRGIREHGHREAKTDPLGIAREGKAPVAPEHYGLSSADLARLPATFVESPLSRTAASADEVVARLRDAYCGSVGYEFHHLRDPGERLWLEEAVEEGTFAAPLTDEAKRRVLQRLTRVETFEQFLPRAFPAQKWFSLEGNDTLVPVLDEILAGAAADVRKVAMGMAHRGRLNVLSHIFGRHYAATFADFRGSEASKGEEDVVDSGGWMRDVKYHKGAVTSIPRANGRALLLQMRSNPSHLELVDPVILGDVRASQDNMSHPGEPRHHWDYAFGILIHGDASFAGQGIVPETLNLSLLPGYRTGGTIHIIANNQIGFTTEPHEQHSTEYSSDVARGYDMPVVHVNGDDVEACLMVARLALAYRQAFHKDIVIDLIGYRRFGHNEGDEPSFTQPLLYDAIARHPTVRAQWAERLVAEGLVTPQEVEAMAQRVRATLQEALDSVKDADISHEPPPQIPDRVGQATAAPTAVPQETLRRLQEEMDRLPDGFVLNPRLERPLKRRKDALVEGKGIDWAHAEALAFASVLADGTSIRLTGQDTERGTFSQRHAVLHDAKTNARFVPLQALPSAQASFDIHNSPLAEVSALGFEYGYSLMNRETLVLWEAQFGDFVNNAQAIIDEFIASAHAKWGQRSGLTLLLPHGYEGQGPNHSSARLERFLQLAAEQNMRVAYPTTAAQYFHLLRSQAALLGQDPRPLVVMTAKSLLRHPVAASTVEELAGGRFSEVLDDKRAQERQDAIHRVVLCSGKVYVDTVTNEAYASAHDVAVIRVEQLYPFPKEAIAQLLRRYRKADELVWLQEEPRNMGAWDYIHDLLEPLLQPGRALEYIGRPRRSTPAEGSTALHKAEQDRIVQEALTRTERSPEAAHGATHAR